jgi:CubicO group peptidase (beta-lactamase class C family)
MRTLRVGSDRCVDVVLLTLVLCTAACYPAAAPQELTEGVWVGRDGARRLALEFAVSHVGAQVTLHVLHDGRKMTEQRAERTWIDLPRLEIRLREGVVYRGQIDLSEQEIRGEWVDHEEAPRQIDLRQVAPESLPGLLARPAPPPGDPVYAYARPPALDDGWPTATWEEVGIDPDIAREAVEQIIAGEAGVIHSLLVARDGKLAIEEYFHGFERSDLHDIAGCTKSVASLLIGIATDQGRIDDVASPVLDRFPEQRPAAGPGWEHVTLEHLLTMTVGRNRGEWQRTGARECLETPFHFVLTDEVSGPHGAHWRYGDRDVNLLAGVIRNATGLHADDFAREYLFEPLGIESWEWGDGKKDGFPMLHGTLQLRPRDVAKIGALILQDGRWDGRQVVSESWVRASTTARVRTAGPEEYGYLWWSSRLPDGRGSDVPAIFASGWGGQLIYVVPSWDAVIVLTAGNQFNRRGFGHGRRLLERLLPAFRR